DLDAKCAADPFVGVQAENPVAGGTVDRELLLRAIPRPISLDDTGTQRLSDRARRVGGMRVNDYNFVAETHRSHTGLDAVGLVVSDDARRESTHALRATPTGLRPCTHSSRAVKGRSQRQCQPNVQ